MRVLGIVLARAGSKRIKNKNLVCLNGLSLMERLSVCINKTNFINRIIVSTDSKKISESAIKLGFDSPFLRPKNYSKDNTSSYEAIIHCLDWIKKNEQFEYDAIINLQLTSPFRNHVTLNRGFRIFKKNIKDDFDSLVTVKKIDESLKPHKHLTLNNSNQIKNLNKKDFKNNLYVRDGIINPLVLKESLFKYKSLYGNKCFGIQSKSFIESIDLNYKHDLELAELVASKLSNE